MTFKRTFGVHPLLDCGDHGPDGHGGGGDHMTTLDLALAQIPESVRSRVLVRTDSGGGVKAFLTHITKLGLPYSASSRSAGWCSAGGRLLVEAVRRVSNWPSTSGRLSRWQRCSLQALREREQDQPSHETRPFSCPAAAPHTARDHMMEMKIGARVSTVGQDLTAQCDRLAARGVDQIYLDHDLTGTSWAAPCTSRPIRSVACFSTSSRWSLGSRPT